MLKKTIQYKNFNGEEVTEDFYFHVHAVDVVRMNAVHKGGFQAYFQTLVDSDNGEEIWNTIEKLILESYGKKSPDGRQHIQSKELTEEFKSSAACDKLIMELCMDAGKAAIFINGIMPAELIEEAAKITAVPSPDYPDPTYISAEAISEMDPRDLATGLADGRYKLAP